MSMVWQRVGDNLFKIEKLRDKKRQIDSVKDSPYNGSVGIFESYLNKDEAKAELIARFLEDVVGMLENQDNSMKEE